MSRPSSKIPCFFVPFVSWFVLLHFFLSHYICSLPLYDFYFLLLCFLSFLLSLFSYFYSFFLSFLFLLSTFPFFLLSFFHSPSFHFFPFFSIFVSHCLSFFFLSIFISFFSSCIMFSASFSCFSLLMVSGKLCWQ